MGKKIPLSFKDTTRDMKLYIAVMAAEEHSAFIKDAIEFYITYKDKLKEVNVNNL